MYRCNCCDNEFETPAKEKQQHEFWGAPCYEEFAVCPFCGETDFDEVNEDDEEDY